MIACVRCCKLLASWQVKKNGDKGQKDEHARPLVISCSANPTPENTASPSLSSREQPAVVSVSHCEERESQQDDLQRMIELMDGFKASKVIQTHSFGLKAHSFSLTRLTDYLPPSYQAGTGRRFKI